MTEGAPSTSWMQRNYKLIAAMAVVGVGLAYVLEQVNPDSIAAFKAKAAVNEYRMRSFVCINELAHKDGTAIQSLKCLDH